MPEVSMWLYPIALAGAIGLFFGLRYGFAWTWGMCLQQLLMMLTAVFGLLAIYVPEPFAFGHPPEQSAQYWAIAAWLLFCLFNFGQRMLISNISNDLSIFRVKQARDKLPL